MLAAIQGGAEDGFELGDRRWGSRLIVGTGGFRSLEQMEEALIASGTEIVTVALRRVDPEAQGSVLDVIRRLGLFALPNTAGCYTARDAVRTAKLAGEAFETDWVKLEVIGDDRTCSRTRSSWWMRRRRWSTTGSRFCRTRTTTRSSPAGSRRRAARR